MIYEFAFRINSIPGFNEIINNSPCDALKLNKLNQITRNNEKYTIIRYNKKLLSDDIVFNVGLLRSLILNESEQAIGFAPPKAMTFTQFYNLYSPTFDDVVAEEFVDGTMINVFWNPTMNSAGGWEISTRNSVGAEILCWNANPKRTYGDLFKEVLNEVNLHVFDLDPRFCYSFVMQHPAISTCPVFTKKRLFLIEMYEIVQTENKTIVVLPQGREQLTTQVSTWKTASVELPQIYEWNNYNELQNRFASFNTPTDCKGVILRNVQTCFRGVIYNPGYNYAREMQRLDGGQLYQYLVLRHQGKLKEFFATGNNNNNNNNNNSKINDKIKYRFLLFRNMVHDFTNTLYQNYVEHYIKKTSSSTVVHDIFRFHMRKLHEHYINNLRHKKEHITNTVVINYVNKIPPPMLLHCLLAVLGLKKRN